MVTARQPVYDARDAVGQCFKTFLLFFYSFDTRHADMVLAIVCYLIDMSDDDDDDDDEYQCCCKVLLL